MASPKIKFKRSSVASKSPSLANIELGEIAMNTFDGDLYVRQDQSSVGVATTVVRVNPWNERGVGVGVSYSGDVNVIGILTASSFKDASGNTVGAAASTFTTQLLITATADQTAFTFTPTYTDGFVNVFMNGIHLVPDTDFTTNSDNTTITLASGAAAGDELLIEAFKTLGDIVHVNNLKTTGNLNVAGILTAATFSTTETNFDVAQLTVTNTNPTINFVDSDHDSDYRIRVAGGTLKIQDTTNSNANRLKINSKGTVTVDEFLHVDTGLKVTGISTHNGNIIPNSNNTHDLGTSSLRFANVYTNDLNLSNQGGSNDVDGTWGSYTIQEGEHSLFLINKRNGKKYKFMLSEI